jgi:pimeloyl-ACP methyl ester carboxylesterase
MNWLHEENQAAKKAPAQAAEAMVQLPGAARANAELGSFGVMLQAAIYFVVATFAVIIYSGAYAVAAISAIFAIAVFTAATAIALSVAVKLPVIRYLVARPVTALVTSVGDAHVWKKIPDSAKAMSDVVQERARDTNGRARKTVVVAHSQGAAVSFDALTLPESPRVDGLVMIGGAVTLLSEGVSPVTLWSTQLPEMYWVNIWTAWDPVSAGPIGDTYAACAHRWRVAYEKLPAAMTPDASPSTPIAGGSAEETASQTQAQPEGHSLLGDIIRDAALGIGTARTGMAETVISFAPAPNAGEPVDWETPGPAEWPVHNQAPLLSDHAKYLENIPQVVAPLASLFARTMRGPRTLKAINRRSTAM